MASFPQAPSLELREIRGPSAVSGGWRRLWTLSWRMARTDFALRYHGSVLGYVWSLLGPLLMFGVLYLAFTEVIRFGDDIKYFAAMLLFNLTLFQFFSEATNISVTSIVARENLVRKMEFPRLAVPLSLVLAAGLALFLNLFVVLGYALASGVPLRATWLLLPLLLVVLTIFTVGMTLVLSSLYVRFRDVAQAWLIGAQALFYTSAVIFPFEFVPEAWRSLLAFNPLVWVFVQARTWIIDPDAPTFTEVMGSSSALARPAIGLVAAVALGVWYFRREAPRAAEEL